MSVLIKTEYLDEDEFVENHHEIYNNTSDDFESVNVKQEIIETNIANDSDSLSKRNFIRVRSDVYEKNSNNNLEENDITEENFENEKSGGLVLNEHYSEAKGGRYMMCAAKDCRNNNNMRKDLYYLKFPRDPETCRIWIENCKRLDIVGKSSEFCHINHRLCSAHFELSMFAEGRLLANAIPTIFPVKNNENDTNPSSNADNENSPLPPPNPVFSIKQILTSKYQCNSCTKSFPTKHNLTLHERIHSGERPYECTKCSKTFQQIANLKTHMLTHTQEKKFECEVCLKKFSQRCHLTKHKQIHEREKLLISYREFLRKNPEVKYETFKGNYKNTDSYCSGEIKKEIDESSSSENGIDATQIKMEEEDDNENDLLEPMEENSNEIYFPQRHSGKNVKDSPYQCKVCNRCYVNDYSLKVHERIHTGIRPYSCHICKKEFFQSSNLKTHIAKHNSEKKFQCKTCNKRFMFEFDLKHHETCHDKEKALECVVCHKTFSHRGNLLKHEKIHTGVKRFACPECDKQFYDGSDLRKHLLVHSKDKPFECQICRRKFSRHTYLKGHMSIHRNDQSFECDECFKVFSTRSLLRRHQARHKARQIGIKPYYCEICHLYFSQTCSLKKHKKTPKHIQLLAERDTDPIKEEPSIKLVTSPIDPTFNIMSKPKTDKEFSTAFLNALKTNMLLSNHKSKNVKPNIEADPLKITNLDVEIINKKKLIKSTPKSEEITLTTKKKSKPAIPSKKQISISDEESLVESCPQKILDKNIDVFVASKEIGKSSRRGSILNKNLPLESVPDDCSKVLKNESRMPRLKLSDLDNVSDSSSNSVLNKSDLDDPKGLNKKEVSVVVMVSDKSKLNIKKSSLLSSGVDIVSASNLEKNKDFGTDVPSTSSKIGECIKYFPSGVEIYKL